MTALKEVGDNFEVLENGSLEMDLRRIEGEGGHGRSGHGAPRDGSQPIRAAGLHHFLGDCSGSESFGRLELDCWALAPLSSTATSICYPGNGKRNVTIRHRASSSKS